MVFIIVSDNYSFSMQLSDHFCNSIGILQDDNNTEQSSTNAQSAPDQKKTGQEGIPFQLFDSIINK